ncbi:hypothetical protein [Nostoc sp. UHCC 0252]|uniref:hypothetical protein n=1 Tax=Nostoc sp. UHCC 0252 TaxID=3110241 RepID=UPI002B20F043|nr:hypothetical protein [Nostoc sp. UHCC 0252]MEA5603505.1 hypothetical protein [Nostoc sp. UHCC 0252]
MQQSGTFAQRLLELRSQGFWDCNNLALRWRDNANLTLPMEEAGGGGHKLIYLWRKKCISSRTAREIRHPYSRATKFIYGDS